MRAPNVFSPIPDLFSKIAACLIFLAAGLGVMYALPRIAEAARMAQAAQELIR